MEEGSTAYVFQSTPSARRATVFVAQLARGRGNFNPRPPRGGRHEKPVVDEKPVVISIHALREEGDLQGGRLDPGTDHFNPRPPRGGRRRAASANSRTYGNFNPRPPRGGRLARLVNFLEISLFQSTPSARRATADEPADSRRIRISIHALREEGDSSARRKPVSGQNFNPRPPRGGRQQTVKSTASVENFNPRPPRGGRLRSLPFSIRSRKFQSTPSARRATCGHSWTATG